RFRGPVPRQGGQVRPRLRRRDPEGGPGRPGRGRRPSLARAMTVIPFPPEPARRSPRPRGGRLLAWRWLADRWPFVVACLLLGSPLSLDADFCCELAAQIRKGPV